MARKHKPEDIIGKLREAEIVLAQGGTVADACGFRGDRARCSDLIARGVPR